MQLALPSGRVSFGVYMPSNHTLSPGYIPEHGHWVECMSCGFEYRAFHIKERWDGLYVCKHCWEPRHPQEFLRVPNDKVAPDQPINIPGATFTDVTFSSTLDSMPDGTFDINPDEDTAEHPSAFSSGFSDGFE